MYFTDGNEVYICPIDWLTERHTLYVISFTYIIYKQWQVSFYVISPGWNELYGILIGHGTLLWNENCSNSYSHHLRMMVIEQGGQNGIKEYD